MSKALRIGSRSQLGRVTSDVLAAKLDQFGYDFDHYGYMDAVETGEEGFEQIRVVLMSEASFCVNCF